MSTIILILHIATAILLLGPVAVSTSMFAPTYRKATSGDSGAGADTAKGALQVLARITRTYGFLSLLVPVFGLVGFFTVDGAMKNGMYHAAILLSVIAWALLIAVIIPKQRIALVAANAVAAGDNPVTDSESAKAQETADKIPGQAAMFGGIFNLLWLITFILMFL